MAIALKEHHIAKYQQLYKKHFGIDLTKAEALDGGLKLVMLTELLLKKSAKNLNFKAVVNN